MVYNSFDNNNNNNKTFCMVPAMTMENYVINNQITHFGSVLTIYVECDVIHTNMCNLWCCLRLTYCQGISNYGLHLINHVCCIVNIIYISTIYVVAFLFFFLSFVLYYYFSQLMLNAMADQMSDVLGAIECIHIIIV